ncbi:MAG TPA: tetratricopeptide repeat protein [Pyrinomonadaceae bacterium]|jgi:tetratricopeptide (TPR) repeat protein
MLFRFRSHAITHALVVSLILFGSLLAHAQAANDLGDAEGDAVKLFERGQDAHARRDYQLALRLYEEALKLRPEFPEAEYQRGAALQLLRRLPEAEAAYRRAVELRPDWAYPLSSLGALLLSDQRFEEAEKLLDRALEQGTLSLPLRVLAANLRLGQKSNSAALQVLLRVLQRATAKHSSAELWRERGSIEAALGNHGAALASYEQALKLNPQDHAALALRAQLRANKGDFEGALADAQAALRLAPNDGALSLQVIDIYLQAGKREEARRAWAALDAETKRRPEASALHNALLSCEETPENRAALEKALTETPRDAQLLACVGAAYRRADPTRSLEFYRRAAEIEPKNVDLAVGYTAALVQARRFEEAAIIARRVLAVAPERYEAHANLATALYELKRFPEALVEFRWLAEAKPDLATVYFFIATAHDFLGQYAEALTAYETFLARADAQANQLEIEKVNLRLPTLRNQVKRGEGAKQKKGM